jgi:hypothetical protein
LIFLNVISFHIHFQGLFPYINSFSSARTAHAMLYIHTHSKQLAPLFVCCKDVAAADDDTEQQHWPMEE